MPLLASSLVDSLVTVTVGIIVTALVGTILAPVVKGRIDRRSERLTSSVDLVESLAIDLWSYWKLALRVAYYGAEGDSAGYKAALIKWHSDESWEIGNRIQAQVSKSKRLLSAAAYEKLKGVQMQVVEHVDARVRDAHKAGEASKWIELQDDLMKKIRIDIDRLLDDVVEDLRPRTWRLR